MRRFAPIILVAFIAAGVVLFTTTTGRQQAAPEAPESAPLFPDLAGDELRKALHDYAAAGHDPLSYRRAREIVYWQLDNEADHVVTIYERRRLELDSGEWPDPELINTEHLWPQSRGAGTGPAKSDLFHIRPSVPRVNSVRSNLPFGSPIAPFDHDAPSGWRQGREADGDEVFLPPPGVRGDVARAMFYFSIRYEKSIDDDEEEDLRRWHADDPVDEAERRRAAAATEAQGNANPFIDDPMLVSRIPDF